MDHLIKSEAEKGQPLRQHLNINLFSPIFKLPMSNPQMLTSESCLRLFSLSSLGLEDVEQLSRLYDRAHAVPK